MKVESCGKRIKKALSIRGIKQSQLSTFLNVDRATINNYINDKYAPKTDRISLIANFLNVDVVWLLGYDVPMERVNVERVQDNDNDLLVASINKLSSEDKQMVIDMINRLSQK